MKLSKRKRLEKAGWKVGSTEEFLDLSKEEAALIELKLALAGNLKKKRRSKRLTQEALAKKLGTSQSRVAKMESADRTVSIDLLIRSLLELGVTREQLGRIIGRKVNTSAA